MKAKLQTNNSLIYTGNHSASPLSKAQASNGGLDQAAQYSSGHSGSVPYTPGFSIVASSNIPRHSKISALFLSGVSTEDKGGNDEAAMIFGDI